MHNLPGGEALLGADHPSGVHHGSAAEVVSLPAQDGQKSHTRPCPVGTLSHTTHTPVPEAHGPRRVAWNAVNDAQLGGLEAVLPLPTLTELHRLCRHTAEVR